MATSVTVEFTSDVTNGIPPTFAVQFTDQSIVVDGFIREWFWDFGDGESANEQNPSHTYTGTGGDMFDVKLTVLVTTGEFDVLVVADTNATFVSGEEQNGLSFVSEPLAFEDYLSNAPIAGVSATATWQLTRTGGTDRQYKRINAIVRVTTAQDNALHILSTNPGDFEIFQGLVSASIGGSITPPDNTPRQLMSVVPGLTAATPVDTFVQVTPIGHLPDVESTNRQHGQNCSFTLRSFTVSVGQIHDNEEKTNYIGMGSPPIAAFSASPTVGFNPLSVQFQNLSTPAVGLPTTYSWRKRISGSGDAFVEFSTAEDPSEDFTK